MTSHRTFSNPILTGCYPDPSICRVGSDYYLVTSTFEYFPGIPVFHSRDLVNWRQIGHALHRPTQIDYHGVEDSCGVFAPTIRYHDGTFYVINTFVRPSDPSPDQNYIVTASDPTGDWSDPIWLRDASGIDPSLFFDDDGRAWYTGNRIPPDGERFEGHREIWLRELDLTTMQLTGPAYSLWEGALRDSIHAEAPHLYKVDGLYYLLIAEGGTAHDHAVTIACSEAITGPYTGNPRNPILTHRHLGHDYPIINTGHADLVQTQEGEWWMIALASRPYDGYFYNLGRETWLMPVRWEEGWPVVSPGTGKIELSYPAPALPEQRWPAPPAYDDFDAPALDMCWNTVRIPAEGVYSLTERPGYLRLYLQPERLSDTSVPAFVGRRQQHIDFAARAVMVFTPATAHEEAGLALRQRGTHNIRFVCTETTTGDTVVRLVRCEAETETLIAEQPVTPGRLYLKVEAVGQRYSFAYATAPEDWQVLAGDVDGRVLSTPVAGGFVGAYIAMYASSNGMESDNYADFDGFEYRGIDR